jgi:hypothetical protein
LGVDVAEREGIDLRMLGAESPSAGVALSNFRWLTSDSSSSSFSTSPEDMIAINVFREDCVVGGVGERGMVVEGGRTGW